MLLRDVLYSDILKNKYLNELYSRLLVEHGVSFFNNSQECDLTSKETTDLLRFSDILSKSPHKTKKEVHRNLSQKIIALLNDIYPNNSKITYISGSVLTNTSNYQGLSLLKTNYNGFDIWTETYNKIIKSNLKVPYESDMYFSQSQKMAFELINDNNYSFSAPTSMGKSFLIRKHIKNNIYSSKQGNYAVIVPTKALINEVSSVFIRELKDDLSKYNYRVITSSNAISLEQNHNFILVLTPERFLYLLVSSPDFRLNHLFIDEAHRISTKDSRSPIYYKIIDIISKRQNTLITFSSPNIPNPEVYLNTISSKNDIIKISDAFKYSPVSQMNFIADLINGTLNVYNELSGQIENVDSIFFKESPELLNTESFIYHVGQNTKNIVYYNATDKAVTSARKFASLIKSYIVSSELDNLIKEIKSDVHTDYFLIDVLKKGVAYHVGYLPTYIKEKIEDLYRDGVIQTIFCTSTLLEGVNLPADNIFVTSHKNGRRNLSVIDFKNLIGRVGRIQYNLYGKVFLTITDDTNASNLSKFKKLLTSKAEPQELSLAIELTEEQREHIVNSLCKGNHIIEKYPAKQTDTSYSSMRKYAKILLKDIISDNHYSYIVRVFSEHLSKEKIEQIKSHFQENSVDIDDDINITVDQSDNLSKAIASGVVYPKDFDYTKSVMPFLNSMSKFFKWDIYEKSDLGNPTLRRWHGVILSQWMQGYGLSQIIAKSIEYKERHTGSSIYINYEKVAYLGTKAHKNQVINDVLNVIDNIILFKISNYFFKFSTKYKELINVNHMPNDWYEFVEFGTSDPLTIFLQRNGFSRESASYIKQNRSQYISTKSENIYLANKSLYIEKESVRKEIMAIKYNIPELFLE